MNNLTIKAGYRALEIVRDEGLDVRRIRVLAGAAGGPKWLMLYNFDRFILSEVLPHLRQPVFLIGSSIGSWRFAAYCTESPLSTLENFFHLYMDQRFSERPSSEEVSSVAKNILDSYLTSLDIRHILSNRRLRLNVFAVRTLGPGVSDRRSILSGYVLLLFLANSLERKLLRFFMDRVLFSDIRDSVPLDILNNTIPIKICELTEENLKKVLMASGAIPLVMKGVKDIPGALPGMYRDGGLFDYHLDLPYKIDDDELVFFPHYSERIIPGWFDKRLNRKPSPENLKNVLFIAPSNAFIEKLPMKKIPDRNDFYLFGLDVKARKEYWQSVVRMTEALVSEFAEALCSGKIRDMVIPF